MKAYIDGAEVDVEPVDAEITTTSDRLVVKTGAGASTAVAIICGSFSIRISNASARHFDPRILSRLARQPASGRHPAASANVLRLPVRCDASHKRVVHMMGRHTATNVLYQI